MDKQNFDKIKGCLANSEHDREVEEIDLLSPLKIREVTFRNRIVMSPMCQYSAYEGFAQEWHMIHLGSRAVGGVALVMVEATAITKQGRISPNDLGIWSDEHIKFLSKIVDFVHCQGAIAGIQLAHAGRKASCDVPWNGGAPLKGELAWETIAPSALAFDEGYSIPKELSLKEIDQIVIDFEEGAKRALEAGFKVIEIHSAHGYLLHEFLSPMSNKRVDSYGGSFENRTRLLIRVVQALRKTIPDSLPLFVRISATDWVEGGWDINQSVQLAKVLKENGVDLIDASSGGLLPKVTIPVGTGYQVPFAQQIRREANILTGAVGLITEPKYANEIITSGFADLVFLGRELLRDPYWPLKAEHELNSDSHWPTPYGYAVKRRAK
ncbi:NADPH dehydrogenase [Candidatus Rubidus massiliensis]|nr:NADPH dehydrogenase [Candidatus Rubidus massiliensis]